MQKSKSNDNFLSFYELQICPVNYLEYVKKCKELNIKNAFYFVGITEKDLERFLSNYHGKIKNYI